MNIQIIETPELDKIAPLEWLTIKSYSLLQKKEINTLLNNHVWVTARRVRIPVGQMETNHIINCINCFNEGRIHEDYLGGKDKWMKIFNNELTKRQ